VEAATSFNGEEAAGEQAQFSPLGSTKMEAASAGGPAVMGVCRTISCRKSQDNRVDCEVIPQEVRQPMSILFGGNQQGIGYEPSGNFFPTHGQGCT
jgi:hypothetical protein